MVVDLQAVDATVPTDLGEWLRSQQWRPEAARRPCEERAGLRAPPARRASISPCRWRGPARSSVSGSNYLDHVKEGPQRDNIPKFQSIFFRMLTSLTPHLQPLMRPQKSDPARL